MIYTNNRPSATQSCIKFKRKLWSFTLWISQYVNVLDNPADLNESVYDASSVHKDSNNRDSFGIVTAVRKNWNTKIK